MRFREVGMIFTNVVLTFKGQQTLDEIYTLHMKDLKDSIKSLETVEMADNAVNELKNLLAIAENRSTILRGGRLVNVDTMVEYNLLEAI